ncbi:pyridoxamine 5'-phosphate oxidase family protein [Selenomonas ruminantium]|uniref:pyridoxamine 5'-phosphate oxidase family protein n=1 Tax=Selenomonas ruminantium TaxID=971 RepID=UPI0026EB1A64|nr:pyridoxamine 5'-phosphate oxidase family protein [Selenomonas ruminantium]
MFRKMRRFKQQLTEEECKEVLREAKRGVLSMLGDDGYPYGIPMNHWYCEVDGILYFHSAKEGHRMDAIRAYDKVSYCAHDEGWQKPGEWALNIRSVVVFGRMQLVTDEEKIRQICSSLVRKFTNDEAYLEQELKHALPRVQCLALLPEHMTGKLVNES